MLFARGMVARRKQNKDILGVVTNPNTTNYIYYLQFVLSGLQQLYNLFESYKN